MCAVPALHTSSQYPPEAGITRSECATAATPARIACNLSSQENYSKVHSVFLRWSTETLWILAACDGCKALNGLTGISLYERQATQMLKMVTVWFPKLVFISAKLGSAFILSDFLDRPILHLLWGKIHRSVITFTTALLHLSNLHQWKARHIFNCQEKRICRPLLSWQQEFELFCIKVSTSLH